ncbi:hypothetical protein QYF36_002517 [Acer negundo]|nr:hypothetical protein QYF36_002517 [Acer negundo]
MKWRKRHRLFLSFVRVLLRENTIVQDPDLVSSCSNAMKTNFDSSVVVAGEDDGFEPLIQLDWNNVNCRWVFWAEKKDADDDLGEAGDRGGIGESMLELTEVNH